MCVIDFRCSQMVWARTAGVCFHSLSYEGVCVIVTEGSRTNQSSTQVRAVFSGVLLLECCLLSVCAVIYKYSCFQMILKIVFSFSAYMPLKMFLMMFLLYKYGNFPNYSLTLRSGCGCNWQHVLHGTVNILFILYTLNIFLSRTY
jgi:hypothetical protein